MNSFAKEKVLCLSVTFFMLIENPRYCKLPGFVKLLQGTVFLKIHFRKDSPGESQGDIPGKSKNV